MFWIGLVVFIAASDVIPGADPGSVVERPLLDNGGPADAHGVLSGSPAVVSCFKLVSAQQKIN